MDISVVFQIAAVGILVAVIKQVLESAGRGELATLASLSGLVLVLFWVIQHVSDLFDTVRILFSL